MNKRNEAPIITVDEIIAMATSKGLTLTSAEATFFARMVPHMAAGLAPKEAGRAVLSRDQELVKLATAKTREGKAFRRGMAAQVYHGVRGRDAMVRAVDDAANA